MSADDDTTLQYRQELDESQDVRTKQSQPTGELPQGQPLSKCGRGRRRSRVTVAIGRLQYALLDESSEDNTVDELIAKLNDDFQNFATYHTALHATLEESQKAKSVSYFASVEHQVGEALARVERWKQCKIDNVAFEEEENPDAPQNSPEQPPEHSQPTLPPMEPEKDEIAHASAMAPVVTAVGDQDVRPLLNPTGTTKEADGVKEDLAALGKKLEKLEDLVSKSIREHRQHSTPLKVHTDVSRTHLIPPRPNLSTIAEHDSLDGQSLKTLVESVHLLAKTAAERQPSTSMSVSHQSMVKMPKFKLTTFKGEPINYWPFIQSFKQQVAAHVQDPGILLGVLRDNISGDVQELLQHCSLRDTPQEAYDRAMEILEETYGRSEHVCQAWLDKFYSLQPVKTTANLKQLNTLLLNCYETLRSVDQLPEFQTKGNLAIVVTKLPNKLKERWQQRAYEILEIEKRKLTLHDLSKFVTRVYKEKSDPNFGGDFDPPGDQKFTNKGNPKGNRVFSVDFGEKKGLPEDIPPQGFQKANVNAIKANKQQKTQSGGQQANSPAKQDRRFECSYCRDAHYLFKCPRFLEITVPARVKFIREKGMCLNCFHARHRASECPSNFRCRVCQGRHHTLLHTNDEVPRFPGPDPRKVGESANALTSEGTYVAATVNTHVALPIVPIVVHSAGQQIVTYALLDNGSTCTLCTLGLVDRLGVSSRPASSTVSTVEAADIHIRSREVDLEVSAVGGMDHYFLQDVLARPTLNLHTNSMAYQYEVDKWPHLRGIEIHDRDISEVEILIGQNYAGFLFQIETRGGPSLDQPFAARSLLGWYVCGPVGQSTKNHYTAMTCATRDPLTERVEKFWEVDKIPGLEERDTEAPSMSHEDRSVIKLWSENARIQDGKYMLPIPFKQMPPELDDNRDQAIGRLISMSRRFAGKPKDLQQYSGSVRKNVNSNYSEKVPPEQIPGPKGKVRYLPHHPVYHPRKPDDPRQVYDCSAKWRGKSLNDLIRQGPDLMNRLLDIIIRFREDRVVTKADIEGMFNQIWVEIEDRDALRYVWWKDDQVGGDIETFRMKTHLFGGVWSPSCANFTIKKTIEDFGKDFADDVKEMLHERLYVDDGIDCQSDIDSAVRVITEARRLLAKGGFNFTKFMSNFTEVLHQLPREHLSSVGRALVDNLPGEIVDVVLGCLWLPREDMLIFKANFKEQLATKRTVLGDMSSMYDPMGLIMSLIITAKMIFQDACRDGIEWDGRLKGKLLARWEAWKSDMQQLAKIHHARCVLPAGVALSTEGLTFQLHHFSDAAVQAYGAASFLLTLEKQQPIGAALVTAKGKLAPMRKMTIPRLELSGAHVSVQMDVYLKGTLSMKIERSFFWTDSMIVLYYVLNLMGRWPTFVGNRVSYIHDNTEVRNWRHVPTKLNPADILSRGATVSELADNYLWEHGPMFLLQTEEHWPTTPRPIPVDMELVEQKKEEVVAMTLSRDERIKKYQVEEVETLLSHWSTWYRLVRSVVYFYKCLYFLASKKKRTKPMLTTPNEWANAEWGVIRYLQRRLKNLEEPHVERQYRKLFPVVDEGLVRVGGRLSKAGIAPDARHPIVIPPGHAAYTIVNEFHAKTGHGAPHRVLYEIGSRFWIIHGGRIARRLVNRCVTCRRGKAPCLQPLMKDLPEARVSGVGPPFTTTGVDYFGPVLVKERRLVKKRYGCLFTCLRTRAIHLEVAWSLDVDSCMLAITRFAARRRWPKIMYSDNGTNLIGADNEMKKCLAERDNGEIAGKLAPSGCEWRFNTPTASHQGGAWERQIRTVRALMMNLGNLQKLTEEGLNTLFCRIEDIVNGRPVTPVSSDPRDLAALSPNSILKPRTDALPRIVDAEEHDLYRKIWRAVEYLSDVFWVRWTKEYLPSLQKRQKWYKQQRSLTVGDLVLLREEHMPRCVWPLARVTEVYPDAEGVVRTVEVRSSQGTYKRPVQKMCLLEAVE